MKPKIDYNEYYSYKKHLREVAWAILAIIDIPGIVAAYSYEDKRYIICASITLITIVVPITYHFLKKRARRRIE